MAVVPLSALAEIARAIASAPPIKESYIDPVTYKNSDSLYARFYQLLLDRKNPDDEQIARALLHDDPSDNRYQVHKSRLKNILLNTLFILDLKEAGHSEYGQAQYRSEKDVFLANILMRLGATTMAKSVARRGIELAAEFELWRNEMSLNKVLRILYGLDGGAEEYDSLEKRYYFLNEVALAEERSADRVRRMTMAYAKTTLNPKDLLPLVQQYAEEVSEESARYRTYSLALSEYRLQTAVAQISWDFHASLRACDEFERQLRESFPKFMMPVRLAEIAIKRLVCSVYLTDFDLGMRAAGSCKSLIAEGTDQWFIYKEYEFLLLSHTRHFEEAYEISKAVTAHPKFELLADVRRERWMTHSCYMDFVLDHGLDKTRVSEVLQKISVLSKDKRGFNAALLILQIAVLIHDNDLEAAAARIENMRVYRQRYLHDAPQTDAFCHLLQILERAAFDADVAQRKAAKTRKRLKVVSEEIFNGIQIVPFEWLWEHILNIVRNLPKRR